MNASDTTITELWWAFLVGSLEPMRARLTRELSGVIQFEITHRSGETSFRYLELIPGSVRAHLGLARECDEWVCTSEAALLAILLGNPGQGGLTITGSRALLRPVLTCLRSAERPRRAAYFRGQP